METLLKERSDIYHKDEGPYHILMYVELDSFIFIDYLLVLIRLKDKVSDINYWKN